MANSSSSCSLGRHTLRLRLSVPPLLPGLRLCVASSSSSPCLSPRRPARQRRSHSTTSRAFKILALESSADDTGAACVDSERRILSNVVIKQHDLHAQYRGIQPLFAQHAHMKNMPLAIRQALQEASLELSEIDAFAFTQGPGMFGCLSVASQSAAALAAATGRPLIGVNHMQGHALTPLMTERQHPPSFPFLTLLISGGHSQLLLAKGLDSYEILVETGSVPLGKCFDRLGAAMQLEYGQGLGPALEQMAARQLGDDETLASLRPLKFPSRESRTFDFDGILASLLRELARLSPASTSAGGQVGCDPTGLEVEDKVAVSRAFQAAVSKILVQRVQAALAEYAERGGEPVESLVVSGGVACNSHIRTSLQNLGKTAGMRVLFPPVALCTDNAAMIANAAVHRFEQRLRLNELDDVMPRRKWSLKDVERAEIEDAESSIK